MTKEPLSPLELAQHLGGSLNFLDAICLLAIVNGTKPNEMEDLLEFHLTSPLFQEAIETTKLPTKDRAIGQFMQFIDTGVLAVYRNQGENNQPLRSTQARSLLKNKKDVIVMLDPTSIKALLGVAKAEGIRQ